MPITKKTTFDISDQVTLIQGRHILHFGGEVLIFRADSTAWGNINSANLGFTGVYTAGSNVGSLASTSGVAYADFLLGYARILVGLGFARIWRPAQESGRLRPG